jgi:hypothetical protein
MKGLGDYSDEDGLRGIDTLPCSISGEALEDIRRNGCEIPPAS